MLPRAGARFALAPGVLALILCAAFPDVLFGDRTLSAAAWVPGVLPSGPVGAVDPGPRLVRDVEGAAWVDEPAPYLVHQALAQGRLPLWNAAEGLGMPLAGNPNMGAFAPLQLPVNLAPSPRLQDVVWLARAFLLGVFTFLLARGLGRGTVASLAAAVALMLSGQTVEWIEHHPLNTDVFVPLVLLGALAVLRRGRLAVAVLAAAVGAGLLGLKPQSALVAAGFGLLWLIAATVDASPLRPGVALRRGFLAWTAGCVLGVGLASVALLSFAETYRNASGLVHAGRSAQSEVSLPLGALSSLVGELGSGVPSATGNEVAPVEGLPYAGLTVLVGAALGVWRGRRRFLTWALAGTVAVLLMRTHGLLPASLAGVPLLGSVNLVKYCFPLYLALGLLLAMGIDSRRLAWSGAALALVVAELLWLTPRAWPRRVDPYAPAPYVDALRGRIAVAPGRISGPIDLAPPLVSAALGLRDLRAIDVLTPRATFEFVSRLVAPSQGVTWILADPDPLLAATAPAANVADLRYVLSRHALRGEDLPAAVRAITTQRRLVRLLDELDRFDIESDRVFAGLHDAGGDRRFHWTCTLPCRMRFDLARLPADFVAGFTTPEADSVTAALRVGDEEIRRTISTAPTAWEELRIGGVARAGKRGSVTLELSGAEQRTVFVGGIGPAPPAHLEQDHERSELEFRTEALASLELRHADEVAHVYENPAALGSAFAAKRVVMNDSRDGVFECLLTSPGEAVACFDRADLLGEEAPLAQGDAKLTIRADEDDLVSLDAESASGATLVLSRLYDPGWRASIDGSEVTVLRTNEAMAAIRVPAGSHRVELRYAPRSLSIGLGISLLSLIVWLTLVVSGLRARRI